MKMAKKSRKAKLSSAECRQFVRKFFEKQAKFKQLQSQFNKLKAQFKPNPFTGKCGVKGLFKRLAAKQNLPETADHRV